MTRMCTDPGVYKLDGSWNAQGLAEEEQVRHEVLWQAAHDGEVPIHTGKCAYCADLLASFQRVQGVLACEEPVTLAVCPGAEDFSRYYYGEPDQKIEEHLKICTLCREDLAFMARSQEPREKAIPLKRKIMWFGAAAAALVFTLLPWPWNKKPELPQHSYQASSRFAALAQPPAMDRAELLAISAVDHHTRIEKVIDLYNKGEYKSAGEFADIIYRTVDDPAAAYLLGLCQYKQGKVKEALESMRAAERTLPMTEFRCWNTLQVALMLGDSDTIKRELKHVGDDPKYQDRCAKIKSLLQS
jgi:tetratricopeptide (TPR) repeat protein